MLYFEVLLVVLVPSMEVWKLDDPKKNGKNGKIGMRRSNEEEKISCSTVQYITIYRLQYFF